MAGEIASAFVRIKPNMAGFRAETQAGVKDAFRGIDKISATAFGAVAAGAKVAVLGVGAVGAAVTVAGFKFDNMRQQAEIAFSTMLGSGQKARAFLNDLQAFAASTPFEFPDLVRSASSLISIGIETNKIIPIMTTLGDVTSGMGTGAEGIKRATIALQQMNAAGRITAEDLNQLRDAGIPVYDLLAASIGKTKAEVAKMAQTGKLGHEELEKLMKGLETGKGLEKFAGLMDKQSHSFSGLLSTIKDTFSQISGTVMEPFFKMATAGLERIVAVGPAVQGAVNKFAGLKGARAKLDFVWEGVKDVATKITGKLKDAVAEIDWTAVWDSTVNVSESLATKLALAVQAVNWATVWEGAAGIAQALADTLKTVDWSAVGETMGTSIADSIKRSVAAAKGLADAFANMVQAVNWERLGIAMGPGLASAVVAGFATLADPAFWARHWDLAFAVALTAFSGPLGKLGGKLVAPFARLGARLGETLILSISGAIERISPRLGEAVLIGLQKIPALVARSLGGLADLVGAIFGRLGRISQFTVKVLGVDALLHTLANLAVSGYDWAVKIGKAIVQGIKDGIGNIPGWLSRKLQAITDGLETAEHDAYRFAIHLGGEIVSGILDGIKSLPGKLKHKLEGYLGDALHGLDVPWGSPVRHAGGHLVGEPLAAGIIDGFMRGIQGLKPAIEKSIGGAMQGAKKGTPAAIAAIVQAAGRYGVDPAAMIAIAMHESSLNAKAVGDKGTSFGLFQLHKGGALGSMSPTAALDALTNALVAAKALAGLGGRGLTGERAVSLLSRGFERPANPEGEIRDAMAHYQQALSYIGKTSMAVVAKTQAALGMGGWRDQVYGPYARPGGSALPGIGQEIGSLAAKAAKTQNIGKAAEEYLTEEQQLLETAYGILRRNLAKATGAARARIEAAMETVHRKIGRLQDMIADAVIVTGDALLPDKLRARLTGLQAAFTARTDLATVMIGDAAERYQAALQKNMQVQAQVMRDELGALRAKLENAKGRQRAAIQAEFAKVRDALKNVNDQVLAALQSTVQGAQTRVSGLFGTVRSKMQAQFEAATQKMVDEVGRQFFQGALTPQEAKLQAFQTAKAQKALQDALLTAQSDLASALSFANPDPADIAAKRAALAAAQEAIDVDRMQTEATRSRADADKAYALAVAKIQQDRQAKEQQMNDDLDRMIESVLNGTGSLTDLNDLAVKYGVTIDAVAIPEMTKLASATQLLTKAFQALMDMIFRMTGRSGVTGEVGSSSITQADAFQKILEDAFANAIAGKKTPGGLAAGGRIRRRTGGTLFNIGEGTHDEAFVVPLEGGPGISDVVDALSPLKVLTQMHAATLAILAELKRHTELLLAANQPGMTHDPLALQVSR